jgi:hypothetical protein
MLRNPTIINKQKKGVMLNGDSLRAEASKTGTVPGPIGGCPRLLRVEATAVAKSLTPTNRIIALSEEFLFKKQEILL